MIYARRKAYLGGSASPYHGLSARLSATEWSVEPFLRRVLARPTSPWQ